MKHHDLFYQGNFGLERETLRTDADGRLAQTPHPFRDDEQITRDFCENQLELITPVCHSVEETIQVLQELHTKTEKKLSEQQEKIWLYSNPPHFSSEQEVPIADFSGKHFSKRNYREALEKRYGKKLMLFFGIHFNFSFPEALLQEWHTGEKSFQEFKDKLYLRLYQQLFQHSWLLVLLTAVSPFYDKSLDGDNLSGIIRSNYASLRNSERGYWNQFIPVLRHESLEAFTGSIQEYIHKGLLFSASELYLPIRLKPRGENTLENLLKTGVDHIELRMFDLNPLAPFGIQEEDLNFAHFLMLYLLSLPDIVLTPEQQKQAVKDHQQASFYHPDKIFFDRALQVFSGMKAYFQDCPKALSVIDFEYKKLTQKRLCEQVPVEICYPA